ncbi:MAG: RDD family protein [Phycisphaerae bacterium]
MIAGAWLAVAWACASGAAAPVAPAMLRVAGSDELVWLARCTSPPGAPQDETISLYYGDTKSPEPAGSPTLPDRRGVLHGLACTPQGALLLFGDGTTQRVTFERSRTGPRWCGQAMPLAISGDATRPDIYCVADGAGIEIPLPTPPAPRTGRARRRTQLTTRPAPGRTLLVLHNDAWQIAARLPDEAQSAEGYWLAARDGRSYLFWRDAAAGPVWFTTQRDGTWDRPSQVPQTDDAAELWAAADRRGAVLVTGTAAASGKPDELALRVRWRTGEEWFASQPLRDEADAVRVRRGATAVAVGAGRLHLATLTDDGRLRVGGSALDGDRRVTWLEPAHGSGGPVPAPRPAFWEWIETFGVMIVLGLALVARQQMLLSPALLPKTTAVAPPLRRLAGLAVDFLPAALLAGPFWTDPLLELSRLVQRIADPRTVQSLSAQRMLPVWLATVGVHATWCLLWELATGTTPGKRLTGCRVVAMGGVRPSARQVLVRNAVRVAELGLALVGLASAFMMLVLSRNAQRLGDVMAGTYVVCARPPLARPVVRELSPEHDEQPVG